MATKNAKLYETSPFILNAFRTYTLLNPRFTFNIHYRMNFHIY